MSGALDVLGVPVDLVDETEALARMAWLHDDPRPGFATYVNPHTANLAFRDAGFGAVLGVAQLRLPDGCGLRIAARRHGVRMPAILNGTDFNVTALRFAAARGWSVFLLGGRPGVADTAAERLMLRIPGLDIRGTHHGYFDEDADSAVAERIRATGAGVVMVALGQPRQERWLEAHLPATGARLGLAVGGFFDFAADAVRRAPRWMNRAGMEWAFRLAQEPRRLAGRYVLGNPAFVWRVYSAPALPRAALTADGEPAATVRAGRGSRWRAAAATARR
jgi:exopolysaccharide biosynthesis WecB/TagA/CpsF family protein